MSVALANTTNNQLNNLALSLLMLLSEITVLQTSDWTCVCFTLANIWVYWLTSSIVLIQAGTQCRHLHLSHCRALWVTIFSITNRSCAIVTDAQVQSEPSANTHTLAHAHQTLSCGLLGHLVVLWAPLSSHNCPTWSSSPFLLSLLQTSCVHQSRKPKRSEWESWPETLTSKIQ